MAPVDKSQRVAIFAGGCFWCSESDFEKVPGVLAVVSGYTGGAQANPSYAEVSSGASGHVEAVAVSYDPSQVRYEDLLQVFWRHIDPTDAGGQFVDRGAQYRSQIFYQNEAEKNAAEASREALFASGRYDKPIATEILPAEHFWPAEAYHQDYYKKNPLRYRYYRHRSGRDQYLEAVWGEERHYRPQEPERMEVNNWQKPSETDLKAMLTPLQYRVTQEEGTEPPFDNPYWNEKRDGLYVDRVSGEPLFSSRDKYDSGTGWPSFTQPLDPAFVLTRSDRKLFVTRTEVRSRHADSHLGHLFADGPAPTGLRYCINSAALRFVPREALEAEGYGDYLALFESP